MILTAVGNVISGCDNRYDLILSSRLGRFEQSTVTRSLISIREANRWQRAVRQWIRILGSRRGEHTDNINPCETALVHAERVKQA